MYEDTKAGLEQAGEQAKDAGRKIADTNRSALRSYLRAAFELQRAGLEALEALQKGAEELTFSLVDRSEEAQSRALDNAGERLRESTERLQELRSRSGELLEENRERLTEARERLQSRLNERQEDAEEATDRTQGRLRDSAEIALKVAKVLETRIETLLTELVDLGRRELEEIEERVESLVQRLDAELEDEIHPISSYDDKNVEEISRELDELDEMQLRTVRAYEVSHKNRVTVLRAIDEKLANRNGVVKSVERAAEKVEAVAEKAAGKVETVAEKAADKVEEALGNPIARYDDKNADEVIARIEKLDATDLIKVRAYEMATKNRVTVLRAIDEKLSDKVEAAS